MRFVPEILKGLSRCDLVAHDFVKLALGKRILFTMPTRGSYTDCLGQTHCNGVTFTLGNHESARPFNYWDECCLRGLTCAQIVQYFELYHGMHGWIVDSSHGGKTTKEFWVHLEFYPPGSVSFDTNREAKLFFKDCVKTIGERWFDKLAKGTKFEGGYHTITGIPDFML